MKKLLALMLAAALALSLVACGGGGGTGDTNTPSGGNGGTASTDAPNGGEGNHANTDTSGGGQQIKNITSVKWVDLYGGSTLVLNDDNTMTLGENSGTWTQEDTVLTWTYKALSGSMIERTADITEENGITIIQPRSEGISDGAATRFTLSKYCPEAQVDEAKASIQKNAGDTVSTDIMELTVKKAALGYYAEGAETSTADGKTTNADTACEPAEGGFYSCNKGHVLVCLDFVLKNTDRASLNTSDYIVTFFIRQGENYAPVRAYDLNNPDGGYGLNLFQAPIAINGSDFVTNGTSNIIVDADESAEIKMVGVAGFEAEDLSAPFELIVDLNNSSGSSEKFIYNIE